ncbi:Cyanovirin-N [Xylaria digitata]|nr:Cyanovirin-N [Xylaria digitata]
MLFFISLLLSALLFPRTTDAGWREECDFGGNAMFNIIRDVPYLSTLCPSSTGRQICTMLDLSYCLMNSHGNLIPTINGHFERSCVGCHLTGRNGTVLHCSCLLFGKDAPYQVTELDLEEIVENRNGLLACWDSPTQLCPGFY